MLTETLTDLIGEFVRVVVVTDGFTRNGFGPQVAVAGELEAKTRAGGTVDYRVMHDEMNFTYFTIANVVRVHPTGTPTIMLSIPVTEEFENAPARACSV